MKHSTISVSRVRRATVEEKKDKRKGRILAFFLHIVLLALAIWPFLVELPEEKTADVTLVMLDFRDPPPIKETSGSSREGASAPAKSGVESQPEPAPQPVEEAAPPTPEPEPTPVEPEPQPTPEPEPVPEPIKQPPTPQPEIKTTKQPEPVKVPPAPPTPPKPTPEPPKPAPPKPTPPAPTPPKPAPEPVPDAAPEAAPEPEKKKPINERISDWFKDNEYSGKDEEGTGAGSTPDGQDGKDGNNTSGSSGTGDSGDGKSDSGDAADGFGDGLFDGLGSLSRKRTYSPPISKLMKQVGRVVVKVCINPRGKVIFAEYDAENSSLDDSGHKERAVEHVLNMTFERKDNAEARECGRLTFRMTQDGFEEE